MSLTISFRGFHFIPIRIFTGYRETGAIYVYIVPFMFRIALAALTPGDLTP